MNRMIASLLCQSTSKIIRWMIFGLLVFACPGYSQIQTSDNAAILHGSIQIQPLKVVSEDSSKIQPSTPIKVMVTVENKGFATNVPGEIFIRYAFSEPLEKEEKSVIFVTEKKQLPAVEPGKKVEISFESVHQIPSLLDFIRHDWSMREYQAIATINQKEHVIGTIALTFSAYYYPGIKREFSTKI